MASLLTCQSIIATGTRRGQICGRVCHNNQEACHYHRVVFAAQNSENVTVRRVRERNDRPSMIAPVTPVRVNRGEQALHAPPAPPRMAPLSEENAEIDFRIPSFQSFSELPLINRYMMEMITNVPYEPPAPGEVEAMADKLVNKLLDAKGSSCMSTGECPICFNDECDLISYPCHEKHLVCISCLEANFKAKYYHIICPHCRKEVGDEPRRSSYQLPSPNMNGALHHVRTSRDDRLYVFVPILERYDDYLRGRAIARAVVYLRNALPHFSIQLMNDSEINPELRHRIHIDVPVRPGHATFGEAHLEDRRKALRVVMSALEEVNYC